MHVLNNDAAYMHTCLLAFFMLFYKYIVPIRGDGIWTFLQYNTDSVVINFWIEQLEKRFYKSDRLKITTKT